MGPRAVAALASLALTLALAQPALLWSYTAGAGIPTSPALADLEGDGTLEVLVGSYDDHVHCLLGDGGFEWKYRTGGGVASSPVIADLDGDGSLEVLAGSADGSLYALNSRGEHVWHFATQGPISAAPAVGDLDGDGRPDVVVGSEDNAVYALGPKGVLLWRRELGGDVLGDPLVADLEGDGSPEVLAGSADGSLSALEGRTGAVRWSHAAKAPVRTAPAAADLDQDGSLEVLFCSDDGTLTALGASGSPLWSFRVQGSARAPPVAADIDGDGYPEVLAGSSEGGLYVLDGRGSFRWNTGSGGVSGRPAVGDLDGDGSPEIAYGTTANSTRVIDALGRELWSYRMSYPVRGAMAIADLTGSDTLALVFASMDAKVYAFGFKRRPQVVSQLQERPRLTRPRPSQRPAAAVDLSNVTGRLDALQRSANETLRLVAAVPSQMNCTGLALPSRGDQEQMADTAARSFRSLAVIALGGAAVLAALLVLALGHHRASALRSRATVFVDCTHGNFVGEGSQGFRQLFASLGQHGSLVFLKTFFLQPKEGDVLVVGVPRKPFTREEVALIDGYVTQKGLRLLLIAEWGGDQKNNEYLNQLVGEYGAYFNPDLICDYDKGGAVTYTPILEGLANHPATRGLIGVRINAACSIAIENRKVQPLVWGSKRSFADQNFNLMPDEFEKKGYVVFMAGLEQGLGKVIMCGDSDLFNDSNLKGYHLALLYNLLAWFASPVEEREPTHIGSSDVIRLLKLGG